MAGKKKADGVNWCLTCHLDIRPQNVKDHLFKGHKVQVLEKDPRDLRFSANGGAETKLPAANFEQNGGQEA